MKRSVFCILSILVVALQGCRVGYQHTADGWVFVTWDEGRGRHEHSIPEADETSFRVLPGKEYASDARHVFFRGHLLRDADSKTFSQIGSYWWKDARAVYFSGEAIPGADPSSFVVLEHYPWSKDKLRAYRYARPMAIRDSASFTSINEHWARDAKAYYSSSIADGGEVVGADYASFEILRGSYARDRSAVFHGRTKIVGADYGTFTVLDEVKARDSLHTYVFGEPTK